MHATFTQVTVALRMLARRPGLSAGRLLTVSVVVAAVSAVFTVASATFLRPLPFSHPDRLRLLYLQPPNTTEFIQANPQFPLTFLRFRERIRSFERVEGSWVAERAVAGEGEPESIIAARVTAGFFPLFGGTTILGRAFTEEEANADARLVVLGHGLWQRRFGSDPAIVGRQLTIDREPHTIVGVIRAGFEPSFSPAQFWTPLNLRSSERVAATFIRTTGLLREGVTTEQATGELRSLLDAIRPEAPQMLKGWDARAIDLQTAQFGSRAPALYMLLAAVGALALIAIANLANLTLADVMHRRTDFAVRTALGASRLRVAGPEILQSLLLAGAGGAVGLVAAAVLVPALLALDPSNTYPAAQVTLDWRIVLCAFAVAALVMVLAVAVPVLRLANRGFALDVNAGAQRSIGGRARSRVRIVLVAAQTALALVLLSAGALVVTTFQRSARIHPGFDPANVLTAQLRLPETSFPTVDSRSAFVEQAIERLESTPGVLAAATTLNPFATGLTFVTLVHVEDRPTPDGQAHTVQYRRISPGYFSALRIPLLQGRVFDRTDRPDTQSIAIVSKSFADRFWPGQDPIGRRIKRGSTATAWSVVVGVVGDVRDISIDQAPVDTVYTPVLQGSAGAAPISLVVRTAGDPGPLVPAVKQAIWAVDAKQPLANVVTMEQFFANTLGPQRFRAILVAACGLLGLLLATIGTYGVTARSVSERRREVGIRLALGATRLGVWWLMASTSLRAVIVGAAAGAAASALTGVALGKLLPELRGGMALFSAGTGVALVAIGALAAMVAARAATAVEPVRALKAD